jgi:hypothetical protein
VVWVLLERERKIKALDCELFYLPIVQIMWRRGPSSATQTSGPEGCLSAVSVRRDDFPLISRPQPGRRGFEISCLHKSSL